MKSIINVALLLISCIAISWLVIVGLSGYLISAVEHSGTMDIEDKRTRL